MGNSIVLPTFDHVSYPWPTQLDIEVGDFCFYNPAAPFGLSGLTAQSLYPAASMPDQGSAADNQQMFARLFAGVSHERHLATDLGSTAPTNENTHDVVPLAICDAPCASTAFKIGDYLGIAENGGSNGILSQQVALVTDPSLAIGMSLQDTASSSVTTIRGAFFARQTPFGPKAAATDGVLREVINYNSAGMGSVTGAGPYTQPYTFVGKLPAGAIPIAWRAYVPTAFAGTSITAVTMQIGTSGTVAAFTGATNNQSLFTVNKKIGSLSSVTFGPLTADTFPQATLTLTGGNTTNAGQVIVEILYIPPMFQ